jgi:hypothetical protein
MLVIDSDRDCRSECNTQASNTDDDKREECSPMLHQPTVVVESDAHDSQSLHQARLGFKVLLAA